MKRLLLWLTLAAVNNGWEVTFDSHPSNVAVLFITYCDDGGQPFFAYQRQDVDGRSTSAYQVWPRIGEPDRRCSTAVSLMRNEKAEGGLSMLSDEYEAESATGSFTSPR